ncbi:MAG: cytochrome oxidase subunit III [Candidatus Marinimicrobia bacterium]|nr:cytochrome oxidase subunit III [Candidatus Neomarinimicrobiota bacterium]
MSDRVEIDLKNRKAKKMMLWFGMISITMTFAGLTSAFIVSSSRPDWLDSFSLPSWFLISTLSILLSSVFFQLAKFNLDKYAGDALKESSKIYKHKKNVNIYLCFTAILAILFVISQFLGFEDIISLGFYFTGPGSSVTTSYIYILVLLHLLHLFAGIIVLSIVIIRFNNKKYDKIKLGFELALIFWHFLGALWIYLFLFIKYFS